MPMPSWPKGGFAWDRPVPEPRPRKSRPLNLGPSLGPLQERAPPCRTQTGPIWPGSGRKAIHTGADDQGRRGPRPRLRLTMAKVLCVLYEDPVPGYPPDYARDGIPVIKQYPGGFPTPTPKAIDFTPGDLLGCVSGELGLRKFLEKGGHTFVVTSDKDGPDSRFERELVDADIVISQPFWPAYMTAERFAKAKKLKLVVTAGIGSDHTDLQAAMDRGVTVAEVTYCNSISVSEHVVMMILALVRNYIPSYQTVVAGGWNIADCAARSYDVEGMQVGTVGAGRIGLGVLRRLKGFDVGLHYTDRHRLPAEVERELGLTWHDS